MVAIVGIPGSTHHRWKRFRIRSEAIAWQSQRYAELRRINPVLGSLPAQILTEEAAAKIRYQDGNRVYPVEAASVQPGTV